MIKSKKELLWENLLASFILNFKERVEITTDELRELICKICSIMDYRSIANNIFKLKTLKMIEQKGSTEIFKINWDKIDEALK